MGDNECCLLGSKDAIARYGLKELINCNNSHFGIPSDLSLAYCNNDALITEELLRKQFKEEKKMNLEITLIGSTTSSREAMMEIYNNLTLRGNLVMLPYMGDVPEDADVVIEQLYNIHREKMKIADFVVVVDQNGYIGKDTKAEIKWCESQGKPVIYASDLGMTDNSKPHKLQK